MAQKKIEDAKISIDSRGIMFLCQNEVCGDDTREKFGYAYSYHIYDPKSGSFDEQLNQFYINVTELKHKEIDLSDSDFSRNIDEESSNLIQKGVTRI